MFGIPVELFRLDKINILDRLSLLPVTALANNNADRKLVLLHDK